MTLEFKNVTKKYRSKTALNGFTATLTEGVYALLGPNGAGKSTLMNILAGLLKPTAGEILLDGQSTEKLGRQFRNILGYLPQDPGFYPTFSGYELMKYYAALKDIKRPEERINELLRFVNLSDDSKRKYKEYSGGMKRRLGIAVCLLNDPKILILDEPTAGLDPKERMRFRNIIGKIGRDKTVILATHIVSDVESIADCFILLKNGETAAVRTADEILDIVDGKVWENVTSAQAAEEYALDRANANIVKRDGEVLLHIVSDDKPFDNSEPVTPTLEDVYMYIFNEASEERSKE